MACTCILFGLHGTSYFKSTKSLWACSSQPPADPSQLSLSLASEGSYHQLLGGSGVVADGGADLTLMACGLFVFKS